MKPYIEIGYDTVPVAWQTVPAGPCNETQIANDADCICMLNFNDTAEARIAAAREVLAAQGFGETEITDMLASVNMEPAEYIYVIGGFGLTFNGSNVRGDVWRSPDGENWEKLIDDGFAPWGRRSDHSVLSFGGYLWLFGGYELDADTYMADVWKSADGITWTQATAEIHPDFIPRKRAWAFVNGDRMYLYGGRLPDNSRIMDLWSSADGVTWVQEFDSNASAFPAGLGTQYLADFNFADAGGLQWNETSNGAAWTFTGGVATLPAGATLGELQQATTIGGLDRFQFSITLVSGAGVSLDVGYIPDGGGPGDRVSVLTASAPGTHKAEVMLDAGTITASLIVTKGGNAAVFDNFTLRPVRTTPSEFSALFQKDGKQYVVNGFGSSETPLFSSADLLTTITTESLDAMPGYGMELCGSIAMPDDGPVYVAGGYNANFFATPSDVFPQALWKLNDDGDGFDLLTDSAPWPGRGYPNLLALNGRLIYIGGTDGTGVDDPDVNNMEVWGVQAGFPADPDAWEHIGDLGMGRRTVQMVVHLADPPPTFCFCTCPPVNYSGPSGALTLKADSGNYSAAVLKPGA